MTNANTAHQQNKLFELELNIRWIMIGLSYHQLVSQIGHHEKTNGGKKCYTLHLIVVINSISSIHPAKVSRLFLQSCSYFVPLTIALLLLLLASIYMAHVSNEPQSSVQGATKVSSSSMVLQSSFPFTAYKSSIWLKRRFSSLQLCKKEVADDDFSRVVNIIILHARSQFANLSSQFNVIIVSLPLLSSSSSYSS